MAIGRCSTAPGGRLRDGGRDMRGTPLGQQHARRAGGLGRAADRADVLRVLHLVEGDEQRVGRGEQIVQFGVRVRVDLSHDALVVGRAAALLELGGGRRLDALAGKPSSRAAPVVAQMRWTRRRRGAQRLVDRVAPVEELPAHGTGTSSGPDGPSRTS